MMLLKNKRKRGHASFSKEVSSSLDLSSKETLPSRAFVAEVIEVEGSNCDLPNHKMVVSGQKRLRPCLA